MKLEELKSDYLINIKEISALNFINEAKDVYIGCTTRICDLESSEILRTRYTALQEAAGAFSSVQIKNMGTIGGNLCNASPACDTAPPLLVFGAKIKLLRGENEKIIPLEDFFLGPGKTALSPEDLLTEIILPESGPNTGSAFYKLNRVKADIAKVSVAIMVEREDTVIKSFRVALGSVAKTPIRLRNVEEMVEGEKFEEDVIEKVSERVSKEIQPITDIRSTKEYRRDVSKYLVRSAVNLAWKRAK
jgi:carbon-monoxide dehydrogenase medium subunit